MINYKKAELSDNIQDIARLIHYTDEYIYPSICEIPNDDWTDFVQQCLNDENNIFNIKNITIAKNGDSVVGMLCVVPFGKQLSFLDNINIPESLNIESANEGYFLPFIQETEEYDGYNVLILCVDEKYRGKGIATQLLDICVKEYGDKNIYIDVVADNDVAVHLYKKFGFNIVKEYMGFSGTETLIPCYTTKRENK